ncbi:MAG: alanine racemase [Omnitrophica WOR_2 bacterium GWF2_38_59]|nr:MAG: alanine racemase [Omnitrophica WOR_2 bacterium GWF2_38_59]OGX49786.1 MAG: alanine racemase [Omnitrophica WOR_2 bacterium RIFOXYA2_FULL_38_17]HBG61384.1 alanine racemase [Candidatus Omnitrophota bacterium]
MIKKNNDAVLTWAEIDLKAIKHNIKELKKLAVANKFIFPSRKGIQKTKPKPPEILAVIKADAYGHGVEQIALLLEKEGVNFFGVSDINEGITLRKLGIEKPILLFETTLASCAKKLIDNNLMPTVCTLELAKALNEYANKKRKIVDIHVKVDTGMGRLGVWHKEAFDFIGELMKLNRLRIMGIFTHFPAADTDQKFTKDQIECLYDLVVRLDKGGLIIPYIHAANSMGLAGYKTHVLNLVRPGLMLYGLFPDNSFKDKIDLKPAMSIRSQVIFLKDIEKGRSISYGRTFFSKSDMTVAVIPIGYNDGYFRLFSNQASVLIGGKRCKVIGRVTMDQIIVDVSSVKGPKIGMPVVILGKQGEETITAEELAEYAKTINYEIVCNLGNRLVRKIL